MVGLGLRQGIRLESFYSLMCSAAPGLCLPPLGLVLDAWPQRGLASALRPTRLMHLPCLPLQVHRLDHEVIPLLAPPTSHLGLCGPRSVNKKTKTWARAWPQATAQAQAHT